MTRLEEVVLKEERLRRLMDEKNLDGILLKKQPNFSWLTAGGLNMVGIATEIGVTSLLLTRTGRFVIANRIEAARMMQDEGLADLGFQLLSHEWYVEREAELVQQVAGNLARVGVDVGFGGCPNLDGEIKKLRYSLTEGEIDPLSPDHVVTLVRFLASPAAEAVNGQVFIVYGPSVTLVAAPIAEHRFTAEGPSWVPQELSSAMQKYFADRDPEVTFAATELMGG